MNQQPDKLFRDKLQDYQPAVSPAAWNRVSGNLGKKTDRMLWLKIAAGLLLLAVAGILLFPTDRQGLPSLVSEKTEKLKEEAPVKQGKVLSEESVAPEPDKSRSTPAPVVEDAPASREKRKAQPDRAVPSPVTETIPSELPVATTEAPLEEIQNHVEADPGVINEPLAGVPSAQTENLIIVYSAQEVDEKYLAKKNTDTEATSEEKETSTWRKLLDKAYDLKHNQDPLGNLRQKKNEILAMNFKNDKQSHENK